MDWIITPVSKLSGELTPPPDKSITHRAIMLAALAEGESLVENYLEGEDCLCTLKAFQSMGVEIDRSGTALKILGAGIRGLKSPKGPIDAGNSGTTVRLLSGILAGQDLEAVITGDASLSKRTMKRIIEPLRSMGASIDAREDNFLPMTIRGTALLKPLEYKSPIASAQVKSCILLAGIHAKGLTSVHEPVKSRDHTERMMLAAGADIKEDGLTVSVKGPAALKPQHIKVPGDISSAAFFLVAGALVPGSKIKVLNTGVNPTRDGIIEALKGMGANISISGASVVSGEPVADITIESSELKAVKITRAMIPRLIDEIPILVLAATQARGTTIISGAEELRHKESDRIKTISRELSKMGAHIEELPDGLKVLGPTPLHGAEIESYGDHRIAMTCAIAGLIAKGKTKIKNAECVATSFPDFLGYLKRL